MKTISNWNEVKESGNSEFKRLPAGGYVCRITKVTDVPASEYLKIEYDVVEGEFKNWWADTEERAGFWGGNFVRSYKDSAAGFFKGFISAVEKSNPGFEWAWDENSLCGKLVGLVLNEEEYRKNNGDVGTRLNVAKNLDVATIRNGDFTVPEKKCLPVVNNPFASTSFAEITDADIPWA